MLSSSQITLRGYFEWDWSDLRSYFWYDFIFLQKNRMSTMMTFSNKSFKSFASKKYSFDESESSTFYEKLFDRPKCLTFYILYNEALEIVE